MKLSLKGTRMISRMFLKTRFIFSLFCSVFFVISYLKFVELYLPARSSDPSYSGLKFQFTWKNFILFNFSLNLLFQILKFCTLTLLVKLSAFLFNYEAPLRAIFGVIVISEFIFLLSDLTVIFWFQFVRPDFTLNEFNNFYPLSLYDLVHDGSPDVEWSYLLKKLSLFELLYILTASVLLKEPLDKPFRQTLTVFVLAYLPFFALWIIVIKVLN